MLWMILKSNIKSQKFYPSLLPNRTILAYPMSSITSITVCSTRFRFKENYEECSCTINWAKQPFWMSPVAQVNDGSHRNITGIVHRNLLHSVRFWFVRREIGPVPFHLHSITLLRQNYVICLITRNTILRQSTCIDVGEAEVDDVHEVSPRTDKKSLMLKVLLLKMSRQTYSRYTEPGIFSQFQDFLPLPVNETP